MKQFLDQKKNMFQCDPDGFYRALPYDEKKEFTIRQSANIQRRQVQITGQHNESKRTDQDEGKRDVIELD